MSSSPAVVATGLGSPVVRGILCVMAGVSCLSVSDTLAKWLGNYYDPLQLLFLRAVLALPPVMVLALLLGGRPALRSSHPGLHLWRGVLNVAAAWCFYAGLTQLPLATSVAIAFAAPLFVTVLAVLFLGERVTRGGWGCLLLGFLGVLLVVQPGSAGFSMAALLPLGTALLYAVMMTSARRLSATEGLITLMFYIALGQAVVSVGLVPWVWTPVAPEHWLPILGIACAATLGLGLLSLGFRLGPPAVVAPFDYTGMLWAVLLGWWIWGDVPNALAALGATLIVSAGVLVAWRARRDARG